MFGFRRSGVNVVMHVALGLLAVKVSLPGGVVEYAICDDALRPIYRPARSLDELQTRFGV